MDLVCQGGTAPAAAGVARRLGCARAVLLGPQDVAGAEVDGVRVRQVSCPWDGPGWDGFLDRAYLRARTLASALALDRELRDAVLHELMYFVAEPWLAGLAAAEQASGLPEATRPFAAVASPGLAGQVFLSRLRADRSTSAAAPASPVVWRGVARPAWTPADVVVVESFASRLRNLADVVQALQEAGRRVALLSLARYPIEREGLGEAAADLGLPVLDWAAILRAGRWTGVGSAAAAAAAAVPRLLPVVGRLLREDGCSPWLMPRLVATAARSVLRMHLLRDVLRAVLERSRPRLLLLSRGSDTLLRLCGGVASGRGVAVLDVEHGKRIGTAPASLRDLSGVDFALSGQGTLELYAAAGVPRERLHAVGSPAFDRLLREAGQPPLAEVPRPYLAYSSGATRIHARWSPDDPHLRLLQALDRHLAARPELHLAIKLHPQEHHDDTRALVSRMASRDRVRVLREAPNGTLFRHAAAQISLGSTTSIEALLLGVPAVVVDLSRRPSDLDAAVAAGALQRVHRLEDLDEALARALARAGPPPPEVVAHYAHRLDGDSVRRTLELAEGLSGAGGGVPPIAPSNNGLARPDGLARSSG